VPILGILWIPGILGLTAFPNAHVRDVLCLTHLPAEIAQIWGVKLLWWSVWLSVVWGGKAARNGMVIFTNSSHHCKPGGGV
jgi:hypothetical protein